MELSQEARTIVDLTTRRTAECIAGKGAKEISQQLVSQEDHEDQRGNPLSIQPLELGPDTRTSADSLGLLGGRIALQTWPAPVIDPEDRKYADLLRACTSDSILRAGNATGDVSAFMNQEREHLLESIDDQVLVAIKKQAACFHAKNPTLSARAIESGDMRGWLDALKLAPGEELQPRTKEVTADGVKVSVTLTPASYKPTPQEVVLARNWVACSGETGYHRAIHDAGVREAGRQAERSQSKMLELKAMLAEARQELER